MGHLRPHLKMQPLVNRDKAARISGRRPGSLVPHETSQFSTVAHRVWSVMHTNQNTPVTRLWPLWSRMPHLPTLGTVRQAARAVLAGVWRRSGPGLAGPPEKCLHRGKTHFGASVFKATISPRGNITQSTHFTSTLPYLDQSPHHHDKFLLLLL